MTETKELSEFAAYIGIDWADEKHAWALHNPTQSVVEQGDLLHKPEAVAAGRLNWRADSGSARSQLRSSSRAGLSSSCFLNTNISSSFRYIPPHW